MKNCLTREILFNYYHDMLDPEEMFLIKNHLGECEKCQHILELIKNDISIVKESLQELNPDIVKIPEFKTDHKIKKIKYSRTLSWAASICLFLTISTLTTVKIIDNQKPVNDYEYFEYIPDMNDAWKENSITVTSFDNKGNPTNHQVITN